MKDLTYFVNRTLSEKGIDNVSIKKLLNKEIVENQLHRLATKPIRSLANVCNESTCEFNTAVAAISQESIFQAACAQVRQTPYAWLGSLIMLEHYATTQSILEGHMIFDSDIDQQNRV